MGRGTIVSGGADGLYKLRLDYGDAKRTAIVQTIDARITKLSDLVIELDGKITAQRIVADAANQAVSDAINELNIQSLIPGMTKEQLDALQNAITAALAEYSAELKALQDLENKKNAAYIEIKTLVSRRRFLQRLPVVSDVDAWCADLTENATGEVATIEIPGEPDRVLIAPSAPAPTASDGQVLMRQLMTPEQAFLNAAILPGWQKWKPTFRTGVIEDILGDICIVNLDEAKSSAKNLPINQSTRLVNVPIQYLSCNGAAFEVGDEVVVRFEGQDWGQPKVIGFVDNPRGCAGFAFSGFGIRPQFPLVGDTYFNNQIRWIYIELVAPMSLHNEVYEADTNSIICTFENEYWGVVSVSSTKYEDIFGQPYYAREFFGSKINIVYVDDIPRLESCGIDMYSFLKDENSYLYPFNKFPNCANPIISIYLQQNRYAQPPIAEGFWLDESHKFSKWKIKLALPGKTLFDGEINMDAQQTVTPYWEDRINNQTTGCVYTGHYVPSSPWTWNGTGIQIPSGVTWIQKA